MVFLRRSSRSSLYHGIRVQVIRPSGRTARRLGAYHSPRFKNCQHISRLTSHAERVRDSETETRRHWPCCPSQVGRVRESARHGRRWDLWMDAARTEPRDPGIPASTRTVFGNQHRENHADPRRTLIYETRNSLIQQRLRPGLA